MESKLCGIYAFFYVYVAMRAMFAILLCVFMVGIRSLNVSQHHIQRTIQTNIGQNSGDQQLLGPSSLHSVDVGHRRSLLSDGLGDGNRSSLLLSNGSDGGNGSSIVAGVSTGFAVFVVAVVCFFTKCFGMR